MIDYNILGKVVDKVKETKGIGKFDETKILIETDDKLPGDITLKNVVLIQLVIKASDQTYQ